MDIRGCAAVVLFGCAHSTTRGPAVAAPLNAPDTAVGAYLVNPTPYEATLEDCTFSGPVKDLRATASGEISARCRHGVSIHWTAVPATSIALRGPATIHAPAKGPVYLYDVIYFAGDKHLGGYGQIAWSTAPSCVGLADLGPYLRATFVMPRAVGICTLQARDDAGRTAELAITIE